MTNSWWTPRPEWVNYHLAWSPVTLTASCVCICVNPFTLRDPLESIVCYFHTFGNNLGLKRKIAKYFKESCCLSSDQHFSFKCFPKKRFCKRNISKIVRPLLAALSVNGFTHILPVATNWWKKPENWLKLWHMVTHLRVLSDSYPVNTNTHDRV